LQASGEREKRGIKNEMGGGFPKRLCTSMTSNLCVACVTKKAARQKNGFD